MGCARNTPPCPSGASPLSEGGNVPVSPLRMKGGTRSAPLDPPPSERGVARSAPPDPPPSERGVARSAGGSTPCVTEGFFTALIAILLSGCALGRAGASPVFREGFEDGIAGWEGGATMAQDAAVAHGGARSLRLAVADPMHDAVYATRKVPVVGGAYYAASCFVKIDNVVEAPGVKPSAGAGFIVEWADKDGAWMKDGQYACGLRGTADWRRVECASLKAPDDAGFVILFLALRDAGTAWFDDIALERVDAGIAKRAPENGAVFANNCPRFEWLPSPGVRAYTVELSQDPAFADGTVRRIAAGGLPRLQLREPLAPGVWHWRVVATGLPDSRPWSFTQTAPQGRDCLPPLVAAKAARVTRGDEPIEVEVEGDVARVAFLAPAFGEVCGFTGRDAPTARPNDGDGGRFVETSLPEDVAPSFTFTFAPPAGGWPAGLTEAAIIAEDISGNASTNVFWLLNAPKPENAVTIGDDGFYRQDGRRIFPLGIYEVEPADMPDVRDAGFDMVHNYLWERTQDDAACRRYLDACGANGLRAFIGFDRGVRTGKGILQGNFGCVARRVGAIADHPALFCWYLYDEPEWLNQFITPERLEEFADLVRALDPYHAVVMTTWGATMKQYRRTWDTHWTQAYGNPAEVLERMEEHRRFLDGESPITLLVNCNDQKQGAARRQGIEPDLTRFSRDYDSLRACALLGIVEKCNGLWWWWFARDCRDYYTAAQCPKAWNDLREVVREMVELRPLVNAPGPERNGRVGDANRPVVWWAKETGGRTTVIAINTSQEPQTVDVPALGDAGKSLVFNRYEVKIFR